MTAVQDLLCELAQLSNPAHRGRRAVRNALVLINPINSRFVGFSEVGQKTGFAEISSDLLEADFWPGTTFVLPVTHAEPAIAAAPLVNASRLMGTNACENLRPPPAIRPGVS